MRPTLDAIFRLCFHRRIPPHRTHDQPSYVRSGLVETKAAIYPPTPSDTAESYPKELRALMIAALAAADCPSISMLSRNLGYKQAERLYC